jgi:hypothetical protein
MVIFTALSTGANTGAVTLNYSAAIIRHNLHVHTLTGQHLTTPVSQTATNISTSSGALTVTLAGTPASDSMVFGAVGSSSDGTPGVTSGTGFTETYDDDTGGSNAAEQQNQYDLDSADTTCDWSALGLVNNVGVAMEIVVAAAGGQSVVPILMRQYRERWM